MRVELPDAPEVPGIDVDCPPLTVLREDQKAWVDEVLGGGLPDGARLEGTGAELTRTRTGWSAMLVEARVLVGDATVEVRLGGFYAFLAHGGHVLVRARDAALYAAERDRLRARLLGAVPDFGGEVAALEDFWGEVSPSTTRRG